MKERIYLEEVEETPGVTFDLGFEYENVENTLTIVDCYGKTICVCDYISFLNLVGRMKELWGDGDD